jgi:peptidoglycan/LPS O-acetylase OafA/YrhL
MALPPVSHEPPKTYVDQLTALRGIACLFVLFGHVIQVFNYTPASGGAFSNWAGFLIRGLFNAEGAVLLFFVLSGCVLAISLSLAGDLGGRVVAGFYVKRLFRLYPLLWLSTFIAMAGVIVTHGLTKKGIFAPWLQINLEAPVTSAHTLLSMAGIYTKYDGPMWSLRVELIYSALFPAIYLLVSKPRYRGWFLAALLMLALMPIAHPQYGTVFGISFGLGALIPCLPRTTRRPHALVVFGAIAILCYDRGILGPFGPPEMIYDLIETLAAFLIVQQIYIGRPAFGVLSHRPLIRIGDLSFSIYLLHLPILLMLFAGLQHFTGLPALITHPSRTQILLGTLTAFITISLSYLTYSYIELPMHNFGRRLAIKIVQNVPSGQARPHGAAAKLPRQA